MGIGVIVVPVLGVIETIAIGKAFGKFNSLYDNNMIIIIATIYFLCRIKNPELKSWTNS